MSFLLPIIFYPSPWFWNEIRRVFLSTCEFPLHVGQPEACNLFAGLQALLITKSVGYRGIQAFFLWL